jgi:hypothetical protein
LVSVNHDGQMFTAGRGITRGCRDWEEEEEEKKGRCLLLGEG